MFKKLVAKAAGETYAPSLTYGFVVTLFVFMVNLCQAQGSYTSQNNHTDNWQNPGAWTESNPTMTDPPPSTSLGGSYVVDVYGYMTLVGNLTITNSGAVMNVYDTLVVIGNLDIDSDVIVGPAGLLIVTGNLTVGGAGGDKLLNSGKVVVVGEYSQTEGNVTGGSGMYIFDDTPTIDPGGTTFPGSTDDENDLTPPLSTFLESIGVGCGFTNYLTGNQGICSGTTPTTITGTAVTGSPIYAWERSTTSATSGFAATGVTTAGFTFGSGLATTTWYRRKVTKSGCTNTSNVVQKLVMGNGGWTGGASTNWHTTANWCNGAVPSSTIDAVIPVTSTNRYPVVTNATLAEVRDLTIHTGASVIVNASRTLNIYRNFSNSGILAVNGTVGLTGPGQQNITGGGLVTENLTINNTSSGSINLGTSVTVKTTLTFTDGNVYLSGNTISLGVNPWTTGTLTYPNYTTPTASDGKFIGGYFKRWMGQGTSAGGAGTPQMFPMGTTSDISPIYISYTGGGSGGAIIVSHTGSTLTTGGLSISDPSTPATILRRQESYWTITSDEGLASGTYAIKAGGTGFGTINNLTHLRLMLQNSVPTSSANGGATGALSPSNVLVSRTGVAYADINKNFYIGSINNITPLPIELIEFKGTVSKRSVAINWSTATEINSEKFIIERSSDGKEFESIGEQASSGNSKTTKEYTYTDESPFTGKNYYRLKSVDLDGSFAYSKIIMVLRTETGDITVYPNPVVNKMFTLYLNDDFGDSFRMTVSDVCGKIILTREFSGHKLQITLPENLVAGVYFVRVNSVNRQETIRVAIR
jgi:hypothetical protein